MKRNYISLFIRLFVSGIQVSYLIYNTIFFITLKVGDFWAVIGKNGNVIKRVVIRRVWYSAITKRARATSTLTQITQIMINYSSFTRRHATQKNEKIGSTNTHLEHLNCEKLAAIGSKGVAICVQFGLYAHSHAICYALVKASAVHIIVIRVKLWFDDHVKSQSGIQNVWWWHLVVYACRSMAARWRTRMRSFLPM